jgi:GTPase SAR1 family protein
MEQIPSKPELSKEDQDLVRNLARRVKDGDAVLFLGPNAVMARDDGGEFIPVTELCARYLSKKYALNLKTEETRELGYVVNLLLVRNQTSELFIQEEIAQFYRETAANYELHPMLRQLAELPFRIVLNACPDHFINREFDQLAKPYSFQFYNYVKPASEIRIPSLEENHALIYNILGSVQRSESLVQTNQQQLAYIQNLTGFNRIPDEITVLFKQFRHHIYLGFDFSEWTLRMILQGLYKNIRHDIQPFAFPFKNQTPTPVKDKLFFQGEYGMQFPDLDMVSFVDALAKECENFIFFKEAPRIKANVLILYNKAYDNDGFDFLQSCLKSLNVNVLTLPDVLPASSSAQFLTDHLDGIHAVLPLLTADFYAEDLLAALDLAKLAAWNNPRNGQLVMPILYKPVEMDEHLGALQTLRPTNRSFIAGSGKEDEYRSQITGVMAKYLELGPFREEPVEAEEPPVSEQPAEPVFQATPVENVVPTPAENNPPPVPQRPAAPRPPKNRRRYPGIQPFSADDAQFIFGRNELMERLAQAVTLERATVLYGESGVGKTSLVNAGCMGIWARQYETLSLRITREEDLAFRRLDEEWGFGEAGQLFAEPHLWAKLKRRQKSIESQILERPLKLILVFDQFEELFANIPDEARARFFEQLESVANAQIPADLRYKLEQRPVFPLSDSGRDIEWWLRPPEVQMLFVIRSQELYRMEELSRRIPALSKNRLEMGPMTVSDARIAIVGPARMEGDFISPPFDFSEAALSEILDFLSAGNKGPVNSFLLQVLCQHFETIAAGHGKAGFTITPEAYGGREGLVNLLRNWYHITLERLGSPERIAAARRVIEDGLVKNDRTQLLVAEEALIHTYRVSVDLLHELEQIGLIKSSRHKDGSIYYEIVRSFILPMVVEARDQRLRAETEAAKNFEAQQKGGNNATRKEARIVFLGEPGTGKTTLIGQLFEGKTQANISEPKSRSIRVIPYEFKSDQPEHSIRVSVWDFGGQELSHSLENLFFNDEALYIVTANSRVEEGNLYNWLYRINQFAPGAKVLVVGTMYDLNPDFKLDAQALHSAFPNIVEVLYFSPKVRTDEVKILGSIYESLKTVGVPESLAPVREAIRKAASKRPVIQFGDFVEICQNSAPLKASDAITVADTLYELGEIYFNRNAAPKLERLVFLRPEWLMDAFLRLFNDERILSNNGWFELDAVNRIWGDSLPGQYSMELLELANHWHLIYRTTNTKGGSLFCATHLLPNYPPAGFEWNGPVGIQQVISYTHMPGDLLLNLMRSMQLRPVNVVGNGQLAWKKGLVLKNETNDTLVFVEMKGSQIELQIVGKTAQLLLELMIEEVERVQIQYGSHFHYSIDALNVVQIDQALSSNFVRSFLKKWEPQAPNPLDRLNAPGPKAILSIENAGINYLAQAHLLEALEARLAQLSGNSDYRLTDTFDLIGGAGLSATLAFQLAFGFSASQVREFAEKDVKKNIHQFAKSNSGQSIYSLNFDSTDSNQWKTGLLHFLREESGGRKLWSNHPEAFHPPFYPEALPKRLSINLIQGFSDPEVPHYLSDDLGMFQNPELLLFHVATHPAYPFKWETGEEKLLLLSIANPNTLPNDSDDPQVRLLAEAQEKHKRLAEWLFAGYAPSGPRVQQELPTGEKVARWLRIDQLAIPAEMPSEEFLRAQAEKALESIDLSMIVPVVLA